MRKTERSFRGVLQRGIFDEKDRIIQSSFLLPDGTEGRQSFAYDDKGNLLRHKRTQIQAGIQESIEERFCCDSEGKLTAYQMWLYPQKEEPRCFIDQQYRYEAEPMHDGENVAYCKETAEEQPAFRLMIEDGRWRYALPNGVPAFQKEWDAAQETMRYLNPAGGTAQWRLAEIGEDFATIHFYETVLTLEQYREIAEYCRKYSPKLSFLSFAPECFAEPAEEVDRIMEWIRETGIYWGIY